MIASIGQALAELNTRREKCRHCFVALVLHESVWIIREEVV